MKKSEKSKLILPLLFLFATNVFAQQFIYKPASLTEEAIPFQKIEGDHLERFTKPFEIQRLSKNVYWVSASYYNVSVVVGEKGVLLIDAPIMRGKRILQAMQEITDKPVTALVYSHAHKDHIGDAAAILEEVKNKIEIYSTKEVADEIISHNMMMPPPTKIISSKGFDFEGIKINVGENLDGHTIDNTSFIINDGGRQILHAVDLVHPDQLEFKNFSLSQDVIKFEADLKTLIDLKWDVMVTGHGNLAYKEDIQFIQSYIADIKSFLGKGFSEIKFEDSIKPGTPYAWFEGYKDGVVGVALKLLANKYRPGREGEFDTVAKSHIETIFWSMFVR